MFPKNQENPNQQKKTTPENFFTEVQLRLLKNTFLSTQYKIKNILLETLFWTTTASFLDFLDTYKGHFISITWKGK